MSIARTLKDKNIKNKLKDKTLLQLRATVASIILLSRANSKEEEEEEELKVY